jgi:hypothetical protein
MLSYMDAVNTTGGYSQPNKHLYISSAGLVLPNIPISGVSKVNINGGQLSGGLVLKQSVADNFMHGLSIERYNAINTWQIIQGGDNNLYIGYASDPSLVSNFVVKMIIKNTGVINLPGLPTSASGLASGDLWNSSGTLKIV